MKPLLIPERFRKARCGYYVRCGHCRKNITTKCGETGKKIHTCKHPQNHRFQSKVNLPGSTKVKVKTWSKEVRDLKEFFRLHDSFLDTIDKVPEPDIKYRPVFLSDCLAWFADWMADVDIPEYQKKNNTKKYIDNQVTNLAHLKKALSLSNIDPDHLLITEFSDRHVAIVHEYLTSQFANKTVNDKIASYRAFFRFLIDESYEVKNVWMKVNRKPAKPKTDIIPLEDFKMLCAAVSPEAGVKFEKKGGSRIGRKNLYRDYLVEAWKFALYSGCRPEELANVKLEDVEDHFIICKNYKVSRAKKAEVLRMIPLFAELESLIQEISSARKLEPSDFLIGPSEENRVALARTISNAFSHYWGQVSDKPRRFYDLRNTFATAAIAIAGKEFSGRIGLHEKLATTITHYQNEQKALENLHGKPLFG